MSDSPQEAYDFSRLQCFLSPEGKLLFNYQVDDIAQLFGFFKNRKGVYLGEPPGSGKTAICCGYINFLRPKRSLILMPGGARGVWLGELKDWLVRPARIQVIEEFAAELDPKAEIVLCSYDLATPKETKNEALYDTSLKLSRALAASSWDFMACDEAHHLGSVKSKRSRFVLGNLFPKCGKVIFASGSIYRNKVDQLYPVFKTCAPELFGNYWEFARRYCHIERTPFGVQVRGGKDAASLKVLSDLARKNFLVRHKKEDILKELPPKLEQKVLVHVPQIDQAIHEQAARDFSEQLQRDEEIKDPNFSNLCLELGQMKVSQILEYIEEAQAEEPEEPLIVFCRHRSVQQALYLSLSARNKVGLVSGDTPQSTRESLVERFQAGAFGIFLCTYAMAEAVTLTRASTIIMAELSTSRLLNEQAEDRAHRIGQTKTVRIKYVLAENSALDRSLYVSYKAKQREHRRFTGE